MHVLKAQIPYDNIRSNNARLSDNEEETNRTSNGEAEDAHAEREQQYK